MAFTNLFLKVIFKYNEINFVKKESYHILLGLLDKQENKHINLHN